MLFRSHFFFFQAEDGIRDSMVTGVQTCALPIYEVGTAGDFVEVGVGGEAGNRAVAEVDGCDLTLKRCTQEVAQNAFAQAIWAFVRAHKNDVVGHEEVAGHGLSGHGASFSV